MGNTNTNRRPDWVELIIMFLYVALVSTVNFVSYTVYIFLWRECGSDCVDSTFLAICVQTVLCVFIMTIGQDIIAYRRKYRARKKDELLGDLNRTIKIDHNTDLHKDSETRTVISPNNFDDDTINLI